MIRSLTALLTAFALWLGGSCTSPAAVVYHGGITIEYYAGQPMTTRETVDYWRFDVAAPSTIQFEARAFGSTLEVSLFRELPGSGPTGPRVWNYLDTSDEFPLPNLLGLDAGRYWFCVTTQRQHFNYFDNWRFDEPQAVLPGTLHGVNGGPGEGRLMWTSEIEYTLSVSTPLENLQYMHGRLDGTFAVPEPSFTALLGFVGALVLVRRRRAHH